MLPRENFATATVFAACCRRPGAWRAAVRHRSKPNADRTVPHQCRKSAKVIESHDGSRSGSRAKGAVKPAITYRPVGACVGCGARSMSTELGGSIPISCCGMITRRSSSLMRWRRRTSWWTKINIPWISPLKPVIWRRRSGRKRSERRGFAMSGWNST